MIELTYADISVDQFIKAFNILLEKDIPINEAINVSRAVDTINKELNIFNKIKEELIKKYGIESKDEGGQQLWTMNGTTPENMAAFEPKYIELFETKFSIPLEKPIELEAKDGTMTGKQAYMLRKLIVVKGSSAA